MRSSHERRHSRWPQRPCSILAGCSTDEPEGGAATGATGAASTPAR